MQPVAHHGQLVSLVRHKIHSLGGTKIAKQRLTRRPRHL
jgi:hypothetical protein